MDVISSTRLVRTAAIALAGAIVGSVAGPNPSPAAPPTTGVSDQDLIVAAVKRVEPSVVSLVVTVNGTRLVPLDPWGQALGGRAYREPVQERASGSGFVYSKAGLIITNAHVVPHGASRIVVTFANGDREPGEVFASNPASDVALVKVDGYAKLPPPLAFADSSKLSAGQWAIAIGEPFALSQSVTLGVVSGFDRDEQIADESGHVRAFHGLMQISAPINPGNSGGPVIDFNGRVIGMSQSTATPQAGAQGIGFAIPSNAVRQAAADLEQSASPAPS